MARPLFNCKHFHKTRRYPKTLRRLRLYSRDSNFSRYSREISTSARVLRVPRCSDAILNGEDRCARKQIHTRSIAGNVECGQTISRCRMLFHRCERTKTHLLRGIFVLTTREQAALVPNDVAISILRLQTANLGKSISFGEGCRMNERP